MIAALAFAALAAAAPEQRIRAAIARATQAAAASTARAEALERQAARAEDAVAALDIEAAAIGAKVRAEQAAVAAARARAALLGRALRAQADEQAIARAPLVQLTATAAMLSRRPPILLLLDGGSIEQATHLRLLIAAVRTEIDRRTRTLAQAEARTDRLLRTAQAELAQIAAARARLETRRTELAAAQARARDLRLALAADAGLARLRAAGLKEQLGDLEVRRATFAAEARFADRLAAIEVPASEQSTPRIASPLYRLPAARLLIGFGETSADGFRARGITLALIPGATIAAPAAGRVSYAAPFGGYGAVVILDHGHGWTSLIAGLRPASVRVGATLAAGAPIGRASGRLIVELRHRGRPVDVTGMARLLAHSS